MNRIIFSLFAFTYLLSSLQAQSVIKFDINTKWTYERVWSASSRVDFQTFEVTDTLSIDSLSCFIISERDTICTIENRVYSKNIYNDLDNGLQLLYDFDSDSIYTTECKSNGYGIENYDVLVDSIRTETIADGQQLTLHYLLAPCYYGGELQNRIIYEGIGASYGSPFPCVNFCNNLSDPFIYELTTLRCFENATESYRFVDYSCDSIVDPPYTMDLANTIFSVGDSWTYERVMIPNPLRFNPLSYSIEGLTEWKGVVAFDLSGLYMFEVDKQIYFWDEGLGRYIKYYDFSGDLSSYNIDYLEEGEIGVYDIRAKCQLTIDSITSRADSLGGIFDIQNVTFDCTYTDHNGTFVQKIYNDEIIVNVGHHQENPKINLANTSVDPPYFPNGIRCFENDSVQYQFKSYPCDTMFSEIRINTEDISQDEIAISPNPNNGLFFINGLGLGFSYDIYSYSGELIKSGIYSGKGIEVNDSGVYIATGILNTQRWSEKFVVIK